MMNLKVSNLSYKYKDGVEALNDVSFNLEGKQFLVVLGESGSGKTTLLKVIAGLFTQTNGKIILNDQDVTDLTTGSRDLSMVFQNYVLYPHLTIYENVYMALNGFPLKEEEKDKRVLDLLTIFGLRSFINFKPRNLSDGQKQRVGICRAIIREPSFLLLDEPLSNLDLPQRSRIRKELKETYNENNTTMIYSTHDLHDAEYLSTVVLLIHAGKLLQFGTFADLKKSPKNLKAAELIYGEEINFVPENECLKGFPIIPENKKKRVYGIPFKAIKSNDKNGQFIGTFESAKVTLKGTVITVNLFGQIKFSFLSDLDDINYKENDAISLDIDFLNCFIF